MAKRYSGHRPEDQPVYWRPTMLDFDSRRLFIPTMSGSPTPHPSLTPSIAATYVVAASDAPAAWKARADAVCDGTADQVQIQAGLDLGYDVLLSPGTFNISATITFDTNNYLRGCGWGTILTSSTAYLKFIAATGSDGSEKTGITLANFQIDGTDSNGIDKGIEFEYVDHSLIWNVYSHGFSDGSNGCGIILITSDYCRVIRNLCTSNLAGIEISSSDNSIITQNTCKSNSYGVWLYSADYNIVALNTCILNDSHGIYLETSNHNTLQINTCKENSQETTNTYDDINLNASDYNNIQGNICRAGGQTNKPKYGINISGATCGGNTVVNNDLYDDGFGTGGYNDSGTDTITVHPGIDDTPVDSELYQPISSNWAYDHINAADPHPVYYLTSEVDAAIDADIATHAAAADPHAGYVKESEFTQDGGILVGTGAGTFQEEAPATARTSLEVPGTTLAEVTLYVDAGSGSDDNPGTSGSPKATIQGALDSLPTIIGHTCTICVRGQQDYAEGNTPLDFSRFTTNARIVIKAVNSSDEDMYDNGKATGGGADDLDDSGASWSADQFNGAYLMIYEGTGKGQIREILDTESNRIVISTGATDWDTNPDNTSYYAIIGGATMNGTGTYHVYMEGKLVDIYGFRHTGATTADIGYYYASAGNAYYNYCDESVRGVVAFYHGEVNGFYNFYDTTTVGCQASYGSICVYRASVMDGGTYGMLLTDMSECICSNSAGYDLYFNGCTTGVLMGLSACDNLLGNEWNGCGTDINPAVPTGTLAWYD